MTFLFHQFKCSAYFSKNKLNSNLYILILEEIYDHPRARFNELFGKWINAFIVESGLNGKTNLFNVLSNIRFVY